MSSALPNVQDANPGFVFETLLAVQAERRCATRLTSTYSAHWALDRRMPAPRRPLQDFRARRPHPVRLPDDHRCHREGWQHLPPLAHERALPRSGISGFDGLDRRPPRASGHPPAGAAHRDRPLRRTVLPGEGTVEPENPVWVEFAKSMVPMVVPAITPLAEAVLAHRPGPDSRARHCCRPRHVRDRHRSSQPRRSHRRARLGRRARGCPRRTLAPLVC